MDQNNQNQNIFIKKIVHCWTYFHSSSLQIANSLKLLWDLTNSCSAPSAESRASSNGINLIATHCKEMYQCIDTFLCSIFLLLFSTNVPERLASLFFERGESWPSCSMKLAASWSPAALPACHVLPSFQQLHLFIASFFVASINVSLPVVNFFVVAK